MSGIPINAQRDLELWLRAQQMVADGWQLPELPPELQRVPPG